MELLIILHQVSIHLGKNGGKNKKNREFLFCSCTGCFNFAEVGAHVKKINDGNEWYIVPLCKECNAKTDNFYVSKNNLTKINSSN
ncbi:hypothetical protein [Fusobacterium animalis]|uniref:hypothetical protein n=1 Tax=Fusobacterium animalis TaxID=76859 RepID=UPI003243FEC7